MASEHSDYGFVMLVKDEVLAEYEERYPKKVSPKIEGWVVTLETFRNHATWGSSNERDRYDGGQDARVGGNLILEGGVSEAVRREFVRGHLDGYINQVYRSLKCYRDGRAAGASLEAADSVRPMLDVMFGLHGRLRPYCKYLE